MYWGLSNATYWLCYFRFISLLKVHPHSDDQKSWEPCSFHDGFPDGNLLWFYQPHDLIFTEPVGLEKCTMTNGMFSIINSISGLWNCHLCLSFSPLFSKGLLARWQSWQTAQWHRVIWRKFTWGTVCKGDNSGDWCGVMQQSDVNSASSTQRSGQGEAMGALRRAVKLSLFIELQDRDFGLWYRGQWICSLWDRVWQSNLLPSSCQIIQ